nr:hypothetical protein [Candidatus Sigynarchaeota archaeon]
MNRKPSLNNRKLGFMIPVVFLSSMVVFSVLSVTIPAFYNEKTMQRHFAYSGDRLVFTSYFYWYRSLNMLAPSPHVIDQISQHRAEEILAFQESDFPPRWEGSTVPDDIVRNISGAYFIDALGHHPPASAPRYNAIGDLVTPLENGTMENMTTWLDWNNSSWHEWELRGMIRAGIDVLMPVFWGNGIHNEFSTEGLPPLVTARNDLAIKITQEANAREPSTNHTVENYGNIIVPRLAMFFDTTCMKQLWAWNMSLTGNASYDYFKLGDGPDLRDPYWQHEFWKCIERFHDLVTGPTLFDWNGYVICWLYGSNWFSDVGDPLGVFNYCKSRFQEKYGSKLLFVGPHGWMKAGIDVVCDWGACCEKNEPLYMPKDHGVACGAISPGFYNIGTFSIPDVIPRLMFRDVAIYKASWQKLIEANVAWVHIETWNEWHEGTDISWTQEYGYKWIDATREMSGIFHDNAGKMTFLFPVNNLPFIIIPLVAFGALIMLYKDFPSKRKDYRSMPQKNQFISKT